MEVTRKRPLEDAETTVASKKRVLVSTIESKLEPNGTDVGARLQEDDNMESFRKDAIYRRMKHYSRQCDRANLTLADLERDKAKCNTALAAMEACWTLLVERLRFLIQKDSSLVQSSSEAAIFEIASHDASDLDEQLSEVLQTKSQTTQELWETLLASDKTLVRGGEVVTRECEKLHNNNVALRAQVSLLRKSHIDTSLALQQTREDLATAEERLDRVKSVKLPSPEQKSPYVKPRSPTPKKEIDPTSPLVKMEPNETEMPNLDTTAPRDQMLLDELESLRSVAKDRQAILEDLSKQIHDLECEKNKLKQQVDSPADETVTSSAVYRALMEKASHVFTTCEDLRGKASRLDEELEHLRLNRTVFEDQVTGDANSKIEELKTQLLKRDHDNNRVRLERDKMQAELHEKTGRLDALSTGYQHSKSLTTARHERIKTLNSENLRLRAGIAAASGEEDLYKLLVGENASDMSLLENLRKENESSRARVQALENALKELSPSDDHRRIIDANIALTDARIRIDKYKALCGTDNADQHNLVTTLESKEEELRKLRLRLVEKDLEIGNQQTSLDQLASSWDTLNDKIDAKLTETWGWEEKIGKMAIEKAKAENKYFSAMRARDTADAERKHAVRNLEKQTKVAERLAESEKELQLQLISQEKETTLLTNHLGELKENLVTMDTDLKVSTSRGEQAERRLSEASRVISKVEDELRDRSLTLRKMEEEVARTGKELERAQSKLRAAASVPISGSAREAELQDEVTKLMTMLKCSTCKQQMRSHILVKCLHTFCKSCIDARLSTRQRKCPYCNLPFAQSEVQPIWFQ